VNLKNEIFTERLSIMSATEADINMIMEMERSPENRRFVWHGTYEEHLSEINDRKSLLLVFRRKTDNIPIGFSLSCIDFKSEVYEFRRIVIIDKNKGYGREAIEWHLKYAFEEMGVNRFWLDVYADNKIGIKLYESLNMHRDGILRQNFKSDRGYMDQVIYSILKGEYISRLPLSGFKRAKTDPQSTC